MMWAVHRLQVVLISVDLDWSIEVVGVIRQMPGDTVEIAFRQMRTDDALVAQPALRFFRPVLQLVPNSGAFGQPKGEAATDLLGEREEIGLFADSEIHVIDHPPSEPESDSRRHQLTYAHGMREPMRPQPSERPPQRSRHLQRE